MFHIGCKLTAFTIGDLRRQHYSSSSDVDDADAVVAPLPDKRGLAPALLNKEALLGLVRCGWILKSDGMRFEKSSESNLFASLGDSLPHLLINSLALEVGTNRRIRPN